MTSKKSSKKTTKRPPSQSESAGKRSTPRSPASRGQAAPGRSAKKAAKKKKGALRSPRAEAKNEALHRAATKKTKATVGKAATKSTKSTKSTRKAHQKSEEKLGAEAAAKNTKGGQARARRASAKNDPTQSPTLGSPPKRRSGPRSTGSSDTTTDMSNDEQQSPPPKESSPSVHDESNESLPIGGVDVDMLGIGSPVFVPGEEDMGDTGDDWNPDPGWADDVSVETRIREIQERLDGLMGPEPASSLDPIRSTASSEPQQSATESAVDSAREVLESEYYRKNWGRGAIRQRTFDVDDFGLDPDFEAKARPAVDFLFRRYFRVEVDGVRHVPDHGRGIVVANHSGALPFDGVMLRHAISTRHSARDDMRWLAEDFSFYLPFLGVAVNRMGAVRACPENATRLLEREHLVGVFPEGVEGMKKLYKDRYRLLRFGRGGFVRLALQTQSPIIPCAIVGAEETHPILFRLDNLSKILGLDYLPITPTFPWLGPLGLIPAPTKWRILFAEPISVDEYGPEAAEDHVLVGRLTEQVRQTISGMLQTSLRRRRSIWLG